MSNNLDLVEDLHWDHPIFERFPPHTTYSYGGKFPPRPDNIEFSVIQGIIWVCDMIIHESRITDAISHGYITATDGSRNDFMNKEETYYLVYVIESFLYSPNAHYYEVHPPQ